MVNYYSAPISTVATSFHNLVTNEAQFLSSWIVRRSYRTSWLRLQIVNPAWTLPRRESGDYWEGAAVAIVVIAYGFTARPVEVQRKYPLELYCPSWRRM